MGQFLRPLGILLAVIFGLALMNGVLKTALRLGWLTSIEARANFIGGFRRWIFKNHKILGLLTLVIMFAHVFIAINVTGGISFTGFLAEANLILIAALGIYGNLRGQKLRQKAWKQVHRGLAILEVVLIALHIFYPYFNFIPMSF